MDYKRIYASLVNRAIDRQFDGYIERHHIVPKCLGGGNEPSNIVRLTPEEHFLAHQLLAKIHPDHHGLAFALLAMTMKVKGHRVGNKQFGWVRRRVSKALKEQRTGVARPKEVMERIWAASRGLKRSPETIERMSASRRGKPHTAEHNAKVSVALKGRQDLHGRQHSEETKQKMRAAAQERRHTPETIAKLTSHAASQTQTERSARAFKAWQTKRAKAAQT
jgi:hypothetical protein